jgi:hypothetical protein
MALSKKQRITNAVGFLSGLFACMDALRNAGVSWPPSEVWAELGGPHRLELGGGIALMVVTLVVSVAKRESRPS